MGTEWSAKYFISRQGCAGQVHVAPSRRVALGQDSFGHSFNWPVSKSVGYWFCHQCWTHSPGAGKEAQKGSTNWTGSLLSTWDDKMIRLGYVGTRTRVLGTSPLSWRGNCIGEVAWHYFSVGQSSPLKSVPTLLGRA